MSSEARAGSTARRCEACAQDVAPVERTGWRNFWGWVALLQFAALVAAIVNTVSAISVDPNTGIVGWLVLWPVAIHPAWGGIPAAIGTFLVAAVLSGKAGERATQNATCPRCGLPVQAPAAAA
ncbi:hypothetical protein AB0907_23985 [Streptomyces sp. NPDC006975]|uniref:hypothetical protein n=1 Tax=Streptomyces sp. NPDC006975 TaxID=3154310 RepID=UPI0034519A31